MRHIGMAVAVAALGGALLTAGGAEACEHPRTEARPAPETPAASPAREDASGEKASAVENAGAVDEPHAARCQCSSAADCTCRKGTCECPRCKKPRVEEGSPLDAERPVSREAPLDGIGA
ncbi:metallothionein [Melittangium boletus]|uniref:Metallothionein n=1 Tax=Melittangium boletus DSM 14713 TaxID=1294270 RepID=A0A250I8G4_9BACT|nr:metallothionein [Melittangium boletus]ATB27256.1 hypothetical protein MEBOL_000694 [Melittangium boletus DSM 14713]